MTSPPKEKGGAGAPPSVQTLDPTSYDESIARPVPLVNPAELVIEFSTLNDTNARNPIKRHRMTWGKMVAALKHPAERASKRACPLIKLATFGDRKNDKGALRHDDNVVDVYGIEGDYDGEKVTPEQAAALLKATGLEAVIYTSASHTPDKPRWRVIAPLSRRHPPGERAALVSILNGILGGILNGESWTLSQTYYYGRVAGVTYEFHHIEGRCLDTLDIEPIGKTGTKGNAADTGAKLSTDSDDHAPDAPELIRQVLTGENYHGALLTLTARYASRGMKPEDIVNTIQGFMLAVDDRSERWKARYGEINRLVFSAVKKFAPFAISYKDIVDRIKNGDLLDTDARSTVQVAIEMLAQASLSSSDEDAVLKLLKERSGASIGALRRDLRRARGRSGESDSGQDHLAIARSARGRMGSDLVIFAQQTFWRYKDRGVWSAVDDRDVKQVIQQTIEADFSSSHDVIRSVVDSVADVLKTECYKEGQQFDVIGRDAINVENGTLFWIDGTMELHPHRQEDYRTTQLPIKYDPNATAPRFTQFLQEVFRGDIDAEAKAAVLLEAVGYSLLPSCKFERFILLIGGGANGKSVVLDTVSALVGVEHVSAVQPSQFGNRFQRAHLQGKLVNIVTEMAEGAEIADAELKSIVSGELTTAEHKMRPPFDFQPFATCWFATNHMPHTRDFSEALFRRAIILQFNNRFDGPENDPHLKEKLRAELPGILNLALAGLARLLERDKFTEVASNEVAKREWRVQADQVAQFVEECCTLDRSSTMPSVAVYDSYQRWALGAGIGKRVNRKTFTQRLERLGVTKAKGTAGARLLVGIRPNPLEDGYDLV